MVTSCVCVPTVKEGVLYEMVSVFIVLVSAHSPPPPPREEVLNHHVTWGNDFRFNCKIFPHPTTEILEPCDVRVSVRKVRACVVRGGSEKSMTVVKGVNGEW